MIDPNKIRRISKKETERFPNLAELSPNEIFLRKGKGLQVGRVFDIHGKAKITGICLKQQVYGKERNLIKVEIMSFGLSNDKEYSKAFKEATRAN